MSRLWERIVGLRPERVWTLDGVSFPIISGGAPVAEPNTVLITGGLPVTANQYLSCRAAGRSTNYSYRISATVLTPAGDIIPLASTFPIRAQDAWQEDEIQLIDGILLSLTATTPTTGVGEAGVYVSVGIKIGTVATDEPVTGLLAGYATYSTVLAWPLNPPAPRLSGPGRATVYQSGDPAPGTLIVDIANWTYKSYLIDSVYFNLITDANAASRYVTISIRTGGGVVLFRAVSAAAQAASQNRSYTVSDLAGAQGLSNDQYLIHIPRVIWPSNSFLRISITNGQGGDNLSAINVFTHEWLAPA